MQKISEILLYQFGLRNAYFQKKLAPLDIFQIQTHCSKMQRYDTLPNDNKSLGKGSCFSFNVTHKLVWTPQVALEMLVKLWVHMGQSSSSRIRSRRFGSFMYVEEALRCCRRCLALPRFLLFFGVFRIDLRCSADVV